MSKVNSAIYSVSTKKIINFALDEDLGKIGDITSNFIIDDHKIINFQITTREEIILCGADITLMVFNQISKRFNYTNPPIITKHFKDGKKLRKNDIIISGSWNAKAIFAAERTALNLIQHLSGIATTTHQYIAQLNNHKTQILDTRKTIPGLRILQKYAVKTGGGTNHRLALYDGILIKDNHIAAAGDIKTAIRAVKQNLPSNSIAIEVECDTIKQVREALKAGADIIMLDNMNLKQIKSVKEIIGKSAKIEVSGGINLKKIKAIAAIGVDYISVGSLTHSVKAADIGLDVL